MPIRWPSINWLGRRSGASAQEQPRAQAGSVAPSAPADTGWHALPPVQRTLGAIELTAPPRTFTSSLTTTQDPSLLSANRPTLLTTGAPVSVLRMTETETNPVAAQATSAPAAQTSRRWMPPLNIQRAGLGAAEATSPIAPPFMSSEAIEPYIATPSHSFVAAADPDELRTVPVVDHVEPRLPSPAVGVEPRQRSVQRAVEPSAPAKSAPRVQQEATVRPIVESAGDGPVLSSIQRSVVDDDATLVSAPGAADALRTVPVVDFSAPGGSPLPVVGEAPRAAPSVTDTLRTPTPGAQSAPAPVASRAVGMPPAANVVQRVAEEPGRTASSPSILATTAVPSPAATGTRAANALQRSVFSETTEARPESTVATPVPAQRTVTGADMNSAGDAHRAVVAEPLTTHGGDQVPRKLGPLSGGPVVGALQRAMDSGAGDSVTGVRSVGMSKTVESPGVSSPAVFDTPVNVQRSSAEQDHPTFVVPSPEHRVAGPGDDGPRWAPTVFEPPIGRTDTLTTQRLVQGDTPASPAASTPVNLPLSAAVRAVQRTAESDAASVGAVQPVVALPVVQRAMNTESGSAPSPFSTATNTPSVSDDNPSSPGRIVLLPPIRTETSEPAGHARELLADSARPMSLQRMFGDFARPAPEPDADTPRQPSEPATAQTVTFDAPAVQRAADSDPDSILSAQAVSEQAAPEHAPSAPAAAAAGAAHGPGQTPADVDELVGRLYEPLAARLRAELWLDRERAGALMGLHR